MAMSWTMASARWSLDANASLMSGGSSILELCDKFIELS
jgi:hypothetical protein